MIKDAQKESFIFNPEETPYHCIQTELRVRMGKKEAPVSKELSPFSPCASEKTESLDGGNIEFENNTPYEVIYNWYCEKDPNL